MQPLPIRRAGELVQEVQPLPVSPVLALERNDSQATEDSLGSSGEDTEEDEEEVGNDDLLELEREEAALLRQLKQERLEDDDIGGSDLDEPVQPLPIRRAGERTRLAPLQPNSPAPRPPKPTAPQVSPRKRVGLAEPKTPLKLAPTESIDALLNAGWDVSPVASLQRNDSQATEESLGSDDEESGDEQAANLSIDSPLSPVLANDSHATEASTEESLGSTEEEEDEDADEDLLELERELMRQVELEKQAAAAEVCRSAGRDTDGEAVEDDSGASDLDESPMATPQPLPSDPGTPASKDTRGRSPTYKGRHPEPSPAQYVFMPKRGAQPALPCLRQLQGTGEAALRNSLDASIIELRGLTLWRETMSAPARERMRASKSLQVEGDSQSRWGKRWTKMKTKGVKEIESQWLRQGSDRGSALSEKKSVQLVSGAVGWLRESLPAELQSAISLPYADFLRLTERLIQDRTGAMEAAVPKSAVLDLKAVCDAMQAEAMAVLDRQLQALAAQESLIAEQLRRHVGRNATRARCSDVLISALLRTTSVEHLFHELRALFVRP